MLAREVVIGEKYVARISGDMTVVEILTRGYRNGWVAKNLRNGEEVYFKTCGCLWCLASKESMKTYLGFVPVETESEPATWAEQNFRVDQSVQLRLAKIIIDVTEGKSVRGLRNEMKLSYGRCEEILEIRDKLIDLLK
jgi:hypothetical protein